MPLGDHEIFEDEDEVVGECFVIYILFSFSITIRALIDILVTL